MKHCSKCGAELKDNALFCPKCGEYTDFENKSEEVNNDIETVDNRPKRICGSLAMSFINIFVIVFLYIGKDMGLFIDKKETLFALSIFAGFLLATALLMSFVDIVLSKYKGSNNAQKRLICGTIGILITITLSIIYFINIL